MFSLFVLTFSTLFISTISIDFCPTASTTGLDTAGCNSFGSTYANTPSLAPLIAEQCCYVVDQIIRFSNRCFAECHDRDLLQCGPCCGDVDGTDTLCGTEERCITTSPLTIGYCEPRKTTDVCRAITQCDTSISDPYACHYRGTTTEQCVADGSGCYVCEPPAPDPTEPETTKDDTGNNGGSHTTKDTTGGNGGSDTTNADTGCVTPHGCNGKLEGSQCPLDDGSGDKGECKPNDNDECLSCVPKPVLTTADTTGGNGGSQTTDDTGNASGTTKDTTGGNGGSATTKDNTPETTDCLHNEGVGCYDGSAYGHYKVITAGECPVCVADPVATDPPGTTKDDSGNNGGSETTDDSTGNGSGTTKDTTGGNGGSETTKDDTNAGSATTEANTPEPTDCLHKEGVRCHDGSAYGEYKVITVGECPVCVADPVATDPPGSETTKDDTGNNGGSETTRDDSTGNNGSGTTEDTTGGNHGGSETTRDDNTKPTEPGTETTKDDSTGNNGSGTTRDTTGDNNGGSETTRDDNTKPTEGNNGGSETTRDDTGNNGGVETTEAEEDCHNWSSYTYNQPCEADPGTGCSLKVRVSLKLCVIINNVWDHQYIYRHALGLLMWQYPCIGCDIICDKQNIYFTDWDLHLISDSSLTGNLNDNTPSATDDCPLCGDDDDLKYQLDATLIVRCASCDNLQERSLAVWEAAEAGTLGPDFSAQCLAYSLNYDDKCGIGFGRVKAEGTITVALYNEQNGEILIKEININGNDASQRGYYVGVVIVFGVLSLFI